MCACAKFSILVGELKERANSARIAHDQGLRDLSEHYVEAGTRILEDILVCLGDTGEVKAMTGISTPLLDKRTWRIGKRLVKMFGSELAAEAWLKEPNSSGEFHGQTPDQYFAVNGESWFDNATCNVYVQEHLDAYLASRSQGGLELDIPESADWTR